MKREIYTKRESGYKSSSICIERNGYLMYIMNDYREIDYIKFMKGDITVDISNVVLGKPDEITLEIDFDNIPLDNKSTDYHIWDNTINEINERNIFPSTVESYKKYFENKKASEDEYLILTEDGKDIKEFNMKERSGKYIKGIFEYDEKCRLIKVLQYNNGKLWHTMEYINYNENNDYATAIETFKFGDKDRVEYIDYISEELSDEEVEKILDDFFDRVKLDKNRTLAKLNSLKYEDIKDYKKGDSFDIREFLS